MSTKLDDAIKVNAEMLEIDWAELGRYFTSHVSEVDAAEFFGGMTESLSGADDFRNMKNHMLNVHANLHQHTKDRLQECIPILWDSDYDYTTMTQD